MEEKLNKRKEILANIDKEYNLLGVLKEELDAINAEIMADLKTRNIESIKFADQTICIAKQKTYLITDEDKLLSLIPEEEKAYYYKLDKRMANNLLQGYIQEKGQIPEGVEVKETEYLRVNQSKK